MQNKEQAPSRHILQKPLIETVFARAEFNIHGLNHLEALKTSSAIFPFAPHCGHIDTLAVLQGFPEELRSNLVFLSAADYWNKKSIKNSLAKAIADMYPLQRENWTPPLYKKTFHQDLPELLEKGKSIVFSPEGTRNPPEMIFENREFKSGLGTLVVETKGIIPVIPIRIIGAEYLMPKGNIPNVPNLLKAKIDIIFGKPAFFESLVSLEKPHRARKHIDQEIKATMIELKPLGK